MKHHSTAIARKTMSQPTKWLLQKGYLQHSVFDYGCGRGKDVDLLREEGLTVSGYDPYTDRSEFMTYGHCNYHAVICNYVLNVVKEKELIKKIFDRLEDKRNCNGRVFVSVRADKQAVKPTWKPQGDGFITPKGTFQRFYDEDKIKELSKLVGKELKILRKNSTFILFEVVA